MRGGGALTITIAMGEQTEPPLQLLVLLVHLLLRLEGHRGAPTGVWGQTHRNHNVTVT